MFSEKSARPDSQCRDSHVQVKVRSSILHCVNRNVGTSDHDQGCGKSVASAAGSFNIKKCDFSVIYILLN